MGIFSKILREPLEKRLQPGGIHNPANSIIDILNGTARGNSTSADISPSEVFGLSAPYRAISILGQQMGVMAKAVYEWDDNESQQRVSKHYLNKIIDRSPSPLYSDFTFWETIMVHANTGGNGYARMFFDQAGRVNELEIVHPHDIVNIWPHSGNRLEYEVRLRKNNVILGSKRIPDDEMLHFKNMTTDGINGLSPVEVHRRNLSFSKVVRDYGHAFYANRAHISSVLKAPSTLTDAAYNRMKKSWQETYHGSENIGTVAILEGGTDLQHVQFSPQDAQYLETQDAQARVAAQIWGVPLAMLEDWDRATWNNVEQMWLMFIKNTLVPWVTRFESELNRKLFSQREQGKRFIKFDMTNLSRGDLQTQGEYFRTLFRMGVLNRNEIRGSIGRPHAEDEFADSYFIEGNNMVPVELIREFHEGGGDTPDPQTILEDDED